MVLKYGGTGIASVEAVPPNGIKFTFSDGSSTTIDIDITAEGVAFDDSQTKLGAANVQEAISLLQKALDDYASLIEENTFEGKQNFNGETEFSSNTEHNADINVHEHTVNVTDTASDSVAKYGAKSVIVDQGGNDPKEINLPNKAGTFARVEDINEKVGFKYAKLENVDTETAKEDAIITEDIDASIGMYHRNGTSQAGFIAQKNYSEQSAVDTTTEGKTTQASVTTANGATIINAQDSDDNKSTMTVTPEAITFNRTPMVNGSELGSIPTITGTEENPIRISALESDKFYYLEGKWAVYNAKVSQLVNIDLDGKVLFKWVKGGSNLGGRNGFTATFYDYNIILNPDSPFSFMRINHSASGCISIVSVMIVGTDYDTIYKLISFPVLSLPLNTRAVDGVSVNASFGYFGQMIFTGYRGSLANFSSDAKSIEYSCGENCLSFLSSGYAKVGEKPNKIWYFSQSPYIKCRMQRGIDGNYDHYFYTFFDVKPKETYAENESPFEMSNGSVVTYMKKNNSSGGWALELVSTTDNAGSAGGSLIQGINGKTVADGTQDYWNEAEMFYAPLTSGSSGQLLQSNGSGKAPTWVNNPALSKAAESVVSAVYVRDAEGVDTTKTYSFSAEGDTIAYRNTSGRLQTATPVSEDDAVNKAYADKFEQKYLSLTGESGTLDDEQYALVTGYDNLIIQRVGLQFVRCGYPSNGQGNYTFVSPYWAKPNGTEEWADYYITIKQDKTWEATIKNHISISEQTYPSVVELTPNTAVNGTLSDDNFDYLTNHDDVKIKLNGEYYILMDDEHTEGIVSYIHEGWNGNSNQVKSINITLATKAWTLVIGKNKYYRHYIQLTVGDKTIYYDFSSTQETAYTADTLPAMPDDIITAFQVVAGGYYSSVSGLVYRNSENALKVILHGMFTTDGATMTYLQLAGSDATFVKDTVKTM